jgi:hypothetical protein
LRGKQNAFSAGIADAIKLGLLNESQVDESVSRLMYVRMRTVKKRHFCAIFVSNASFYQDRLGTNIGKTQKRVAFP